MGRVKHVCQKHQIKAKSNKLDLLEPLSSFIYIVVFEMSRPDGTRLCEAVP